MLPRTVGVQDDEDWRHFWSGPGLAADPNKFVYGFYRRSAAATEETAPDGAFHGHILFDQWYYEVRGGGIVRPHFVRRE